MGDRLLWLVVEQQSHHAYHPQEQVEVSGGGWSGFAYFGDDQTPAVRAVRARLVAVSACGSRAFEQYVRSLPRPGSVPYPGLQWLPAGAMVLARVVVTRGWRRGGCVLLAGALLAARGGVLIRASRICAACSGEAMIASR